MGKAERRRNAVSWCMFMFHDFLENEIVGFDENLTVAF